MNALGRAQNGTKWADSKTEFVNLESEDNLEEFELVVVSNTLGSMGE